MDRIVAADSGKIRWDNFLSLVGIAISIDNYGEFKHEYFEVISEHLEKYDLDGRRKIFKTQDLKNSLPAYDLEEFHVKLVEDMLQIPSIKRVQVTNSYIHQPVMTWKGHVEGLDFTDKILSQYYPIIPVWRYFVREKYPMETVMINGIQGRITKAWKHVGKSAKEVYILPFGDQTSPAISLCDLLCGYIRHTVHRITATGIYEQLKNKTPAYVDTEFIGDEYIDHISPSHTHSLKTELHYPHPLLLIKTSPELDRTIIQDSDLFIDLLSLANELNGAVSFEDLKNHHKILKKGDVFICMDNEGFQEMKMVEALNPSRKVEVMNIDMFYDFLESLNDGEMLVD